MTEEDCGEVEYLDEDSEVMQNYVLKDSVSAAPIPEIIVDGEDYETKITLLVERDPVINKRKEKTEEQDSDYDPSQDSDYDYDFNPQLPKRRRVSARKPPKPVAHTQGAAHKSRNVTAKKPAAPVKRSSKTSKPVTKPTYVYKNECPDRKKMDIQIPDYEDGLCLSARVVKRGGYHRPLLREWNNLCLKYMKKQDIFLTAVSGEVKSSRRTTLLKLATNKKTRHLEILVQNKIQVLNNEGEKKSGLFKAFLPHCREKRLVTSYKMRYGPQSYAHHKNEVVLTNEDINGEEMLVAYKPKEALSAIYKYISKNSVNEELEDEPEKVCCGVLKEVASCKVCAPCYQASWRGIKKGDKGSGSVPCAVCSRTFVSVYSLLTHLKTHHSNEEVRAHGGALSTTLTGMVGYHYKCRICQKQFPTITELRQHVFKHQGKDFFKCEVGNHLAS